MVVARFGRRAKRSAYFLLPRSAAPLFTDAVPCCRAAACQVFFIRDGMKFPDMVHAFKPNPKSHIQEAWRIMDFLSHHPESCHMVRGRAGEGARGDGGATARDTSHVVRGRGGGGHDFLACKEGCP